DLGEVLFEEGLAIRGRVKLASGKGVEGAQLYVIDNVLRSAWGYSVAREVGSSDVEQESVNPYQHLEVRATSDRLGNYEITGLSVGSVQIALWHPKYRSHPVDATLKEGEGDLNLDIIVSPPGSIVGNVQLSAEMIEAIKLSLKDNREWDDYGPDLPRKEGEEGPVDDSNRLIPNGAYLSVSLHKPDSKGSAPATWMGSSDALAHEGGDSNGNFTFRDVASGEYIVRGRINSFTSHDAKVVVHADAQSMVTLTFPMPGEVYGRVIGKDGQPMRNERVALKSSMVDWGGIGMSTRTDDQGQYRLLGVPTGTFLLTLRSDGERFDAAYFVERSVDVAEGKRVEKNLDLSKSTGITIKGKVTVNGESYFHNVMLYTGGNERLVVRQIRLKGDGSFEVDNVTPARYYLSLEGESSTRLTLDLSKASGEVIVERDFKTALLRGRVSLAQGGDLSDTRIEVQVAEEEAFGRDLMKEFGDVPSTNCDAEGNYEIALLTGVRYRVAAKHPNYAQMSATRQHNGEGTQNFVLN
ncbi:MAG: carboxypeptidase regulatory-like domain-containing protein, partial [Planctomycetes bacterium]|nr:carboxypeptidase regulatory-like domain-containing protein [Planctomycetota bacterium]